MKIQENQLKQDNPQDASINGETAEPNEVSVIQLPIKSSEEHTEKSERFSTVESDNDKWQQQSFAEMRRSNRIKF